GLVAPLSPAQPTEVAADQIDDMYRQPADYSSSTQTVTWPCPWSYCYVEYLVFVAQAGTYELAIDYTAGNMAGPQGLRVTFDDDAAGSSAVPAPAASGQMKATHTFAAGTHSVRLAHPLYDFGAFGGAPTSGKLTFTPQ